jgi:predicted ATPase
MLDWSYNLLTEPEKKILSRLSVFVGAFSIKSACEVAAEAELDDERVTDAITSLLAKSLISKCLSGKKLNPMNHL